MKYLKYINKHVKSFEGKSVLITGANSGIGFTLAKQIAYLKGSVIMACRSLERASKAKEEILKEVSDSKIDIMLYDQSSFDSIKEFSKNLRAKYEKIDAAIFNAGIYHPKNDMLTMDGFPLTIGTNYVGLYYLFEHIKDYLIENHTEIVVVTSLVENTVRGKNLEKEFKNKKGNSHAYAVSKRYDTQLAVYMLDEVKDNCKVILTHPGIASTNIFSHPESSFTASFKKAGRWFTRTFTNSAEKSSLTTLVALFNKDVKSFDMISPRGLFHIAGYPSKRKFAPKKYRNEALIEYTKNLISSKN